MRHYTAWIFVIQYQRYVDIIRDIFSIKDIDKIELWSHSRAVRFVNKLQLCLIRVNMITETLLALE